MKKSYADALFIFLILAVVAFMYWVVTYFSGEGLQCLRNPYTYANSKVGDVTCLCQGTNKANQRIEYSFNATGFIPKIIEGGRKVEEINWSTLNTILINQSQGR